MMSESPLTSDEEYPISSTEGVNSDGQDLGRKQDVRVTKCEVKSSVDSSMSDNPPFKQFSAENGSGSQCLIKPTYASNGSNYFRTLENKKRKLEEPEYSDKEGSTGTCQIPGSSGSKPKRIRGKKICDGEGMVYLSVILKLLEKTDIDEVLQRVRKMDWDWSHNGINLHAMILKEGGKFVPVDRTGTAMKTYFKAKLRGENEPFELQHIFNYNLRPTCTTEEVNKLNLLIRMYKGLPVHGKKPTDPKN